MTPAEIKSIRRSLNLTQQQLADKLLISYGLVQSLELGRRKPTARTLRDLQVLAKKAAKAK